MPKPNPLRSALAESADSKRVRGENAARTQEPEARGAHFRPGREGKSNVTGYFPPEVKTQLRMLAAEQDKTIQQLLGEALNGLFAKYGKVECAPIDKN